MRFIYAFLFVLSLVSEVRAEDGQLKFSDFDTWITRSIKESILVGGHTRTLYELGPTGSFNGARAFTNQGGCPWANSNVYANVGGVVKTNVSVYPDKHGSGKCAKLYTHIVNCKAIGVINISVLAGGSIFTGNVIEPITSSSNPMSKINVGVPFTKRPKAIKFDYKYYNPGGNTRIKETGFSKTKIVEGKDMAECVCLLQKRWEDEDGNILTADTVAIPDAPNVEKVEVSKKDGKPNMPSSQVIRYAKRFWDEAEDVYEKHIPWYSNFRMNLSTMGSAGGAGLTVVGVFMLFINTFNKLSKVNTKKHNLDTDLEDEED